MATKRRVVSNKGKDNGLSMVRLDKWLWAARFFKTRALARQAIDGGKVELDGVRAKPGKNVITGMKLRIRIAHDLREIIIDNVSDKRGPAKVAQQLYRETTESLQRRAVAAEQRKLATQVIQYDQNRPEKHDRRKMQQFKRYQ